MQSIKEVKRQIKAVQNIQKITSAMEMVSASKLKKVQEKLTAIRPYSQKLFEIVNSLISTSSKIDHPLFKTREESNISLIVIASDKGLCGSYNTNIAKRANIEIAKMPEKPLLYQIGKKPTPYITNYSNIDKNYNALAGSISLSELTTLAVKLTNDFLSGKTDSVYILYTKYVNAVTFTPNLIKFLPISPNKNDENQFQNDYIFEPDPNLILKDLIPRYINITFFSTALESFASEYAARMNAMRNATDNAGELIDSLTLAYNKARQSGITKELLDIVGGAEALNN